MKRSSRIIGAAGVAASLALVTWVGYGLLAGRSQSPASSDPDSLPTSDTAEITKASFDITTVATGELEAKKQIEIRSRVEQQAVIQEVIAEGTKVKEGDVLVRLNADRIQTAIDEGSRRKTRAATPALKHTASASFQPKWVNM